MRIVDKAGMPAVVRFLRGQLRRFDASKLEKVEMLRTLRVFSWDGGCQPENDGTYSVRVNIPRHLVLPIHGKRCAACWARNEFALPCPSCGADEVFELKSAEEMMVLVLGHEIDHYLVYTGQRKAPEEAEEDIAFDVGRQWVRRWRCGNGRRGWRGPCA